MTFSRVTLDVFLCGELPPRPERDDPRHRNWRAGYWWDPQQYLAATTPQRVLTESLASRTPAGARTALRMLGVLGLDGHPVWDVLATGGGPT